MGLKKYIQKRVFSSTPEPKGKASESIKTHSPTGFRFVLQEHNASQLHYDFRLELGGVLKSWAVPKGISLDQHMHHLAIQTEDHPVEYLKFAGTIPEGNYGAGTVKIVDSGTYSPRTDTKDPSKELQKELKAGHLTFVLKGKKLKGEFALIKNERYGKNNWLIIKKDDAFARPDKEVKRADISASAKVAPMLATLVAESFNSKEWFFEIKWDGFRAIADLQENRVDLYSRNSSDFSRRFSEIHTELSGLNISATLDGEIVALDEKGMPHFEWLSSRQTNPRGELVYYVFDILRLDHKDLTSNTFEQRRKILKNLLKKHVPKKGRIRLSEGLESRGKAYFAKAKKLQLEGVVAKRLTSTYQQSVRGKDWLKIKTHFTQEFVVGGYTQPRGSRSSIGALMVGTYQNNKLQYNGRVGTGLDEKTLSELLEKLQKLKSKQSYFENPAQPNETVSWVKPELVCQVKFAEWTSEGLLRQPVFLGLREDKKAKDVVREKPTLLEDSRKSQPSIDEKNEDFTNPNKVFFPRPGYTKEDLLQYYETVADVLLPYLKDRPQSLLRQPDGINGMAFFQKDIGDFVPNWAKTSLRHSSSANKDIRYLVCNDVRTLRYMVQLGCIEINPWASKIQTPASPDWIVIDLDPEGIGFAKVIEVAQVVHEVCQELGIAHYPKTSGKTGIHIVIPLGAKYRYDQARKFAFLIATIVHERTKGITSIERSPKKRPHKIYLDYLQNSEGQTVAAPYCVRPTKMANVSTPILWSELHKSLRPEDFTIKNVSARIAKIGDIFAPVLKESVDISKALESI